MVVYTLALLTKALVTRDASLWQAFFPTASYESNETRIGLTCRPLGHPALVPCVDVERFAVVAQA